MKNKQTEKFAGNAPAVYWDWENLHASLFDLAHGMGSYQHLYRMIQSVLVNIKAVMNYVASYGAPLVNRAYANWQYFPRYRHDLNEYGLDLVQFFPRGRNMKNGADIRLALDVAEDINCYPHITHVVIIACDSDYVSLAQKVRRSGREIIGIGVEESSSEYWIKACNEFKFYRTLLERSNEEIPEGEIRYKQTTVRNGEELLMGAMQRLISQKGEKSL